MPLRAVEEGERAWLRETLAALWGEQVLGRGRAWRPAELDALVAIEGEERLGIATYEVAGEEAALRPGAVNAARDRKPSIPLSGAEGIPIRDEIDLVLELGPRG
jgi:hypothetical protein